jgi:DNA-binding NtrC family response regulator
MGMTTTVTGSRILVAAVEGGIGRILATAFGSEDSVNILFRRDEEGILKTASEGRLDLILLDVELKSIESGKLILDLKKKQPDVQVIVIAGKHEIENVVDLLQPYEIGYLIKPVNTELLVTKVRNVLRQLQPHEVQYDLDEEGPASSLRYPSAFQDIITADPKMIAIFHYIEAFAATSYPVVITGETGVGKELIAKSIHKVSGRSGEFVAVNVAGLDDNMFTDTLFGHKAGAFTGAEKSRAGIIEKAAGGTLFLDEIGDLGPGSQVKLLRLLQEKEYYPLGVDEPKRTDTRVIVATNRDLTKAQEGGEFRKDLYYRLRSHHVHVPPLRERLDDLPLLLDYFLERTSLELGVRKPKPPTELVTLLSNYTFPGNVRELEVMVRDAVASHSSGVMSMNVFRKAVGDRLIISRVRRCTLPQDARDLLTMFDSLPTMRQLGDLLIAEALRRCNSNQSIAAQLIGVSRQTLNRRLKRIPLVAEN